MAEAIPEEGTHVEDGEVPVVKKENPALSDMSLATLSKTVKDKEKYLLAMRLNIPTCTIVQMKAHAEQLGQAENSLSQLFLLDWKRRNTAAKEREKLALLERGFRDILREDVANAVRDCGLAEQEITLEALKGQI